VYLISNGVAHKIGIAGQHTDRLDQHRRHGWQVFGIREFVFGDQAYQVEQEVLLWLRDDLQLPPHYQPGEMPQRGETETVSARAIVLKVLWDRILATWPAAGQSREVAGGVQRRLEQPLTEGGRGRSFRHGGVCVGDLDVKCHCPRHSAQR
jgi:hypothetical protein